MSHSNTPAVKKLAPLTTPMSSLICVTAAEHHTAEKYSKTGRAKSRKHLTRSNLSWNTRQDFLKIPSLWEANLETVLKCFSMHIMESNVNSNIISLSSDSFSTVLPIVMGVPGMHYGWPGALLAFNLIPQRSYHPLTLPKSRFKDSSIVTLLLLTNVCCQYWWIYNSHQKWSHLHNLSGYTSEWKRTPRGTGEQ